MKKIFALMMVFVLMLGLVACGGEEAVDSPNPAEITLSMKEANYVKLLLPDDFKDFEITDGNAMAQGVGSSVVITESFYTDDKLEDMTEEAMIELLSSSYSNLEVLEYKNDFQIDGIDAVMITAKGQGGSTSKDRTVRYIMVFFEIEGQQASQQIIFGYNTDENTALELKMEEIMESIILE